MGRATQELKQRCSGCMVTAARLFVLPSGSWLRWFQGALSIEEITSRGRLYENAVGVPLHGNGIALRVTSDIILSKRVLQGTLLMLKARRHDMIFHYREGRAVRASAPGGLTLRACNQHFINSSPSRTQVIGSAALPWQRIYRQGLK